MRRNTRTTGLNRWAGQVIAIALTAFVVFAGASAHAQVKDIDPHDVVVTGDRVYVRSGAGGVWYAVGHVNTGDLLRVTGEDYKWLRVDYPSDIAATVSVEDADYLSERGVVVITRPSRLKAHNIHGSRLNDSWKNLLTEPVAPGVELKYVDTLTSADGQTEGYLVIPPKTAQGYISQQFTRLATPSEIAAHQAAQRQTETLAAKPTSAQPQRTLPKPIAEPKPKPTETIAAVPDKKLAEPKPSKRPAPVKFAPVKAATTTPVPHNKLPPAPQEKSVTITDASSPRSAPTSVEKKQPATATVARSESTDASPATLEDLDKAYKALTLEPIEQAEIQPLIAEYLRLAATLAHGDSDLPTLKAISSRISLLEVRQQVQKNLAELDETSAAASANADQIASKLALLDRTRPYQLVGRLTASALYNGRTLPLMYRLQSVEGGSGRTLAYLVPNAGIDLNGRLGQIIGVSGDSRIDPALKLRIVHPTRIDTLKP